MTPTAKRRRALASIAIATTVFMTGLVASPAHADPDTACTIRTITEDQLSNIASTCDLTGWTITTPAGATMAVPKQGTYVVLNAQRDDGQEEPAIAVLHSEAGGVALSRDGVVYTSNSRSARSDLEAEHERSDQRSSSPGTLAVSKCNAAAPYVLRSKWSANVMNWAYASAGQPSSSALARIQAGAGTIAGGLSATCGHRPNGLTVPYRGTSGGGVDATTSGCNAFGGGANVVGWGNISVATWFAFTCSWNTIGGYKWEADIKFDNSSRSWFMNSSATGCTGGRTDLWGAATHEFGHAVGLDHVHQSEPQVMNPYLSGCSMVWRQLGRGDQNGLRAHYGS